MRTFLLMSCIRLFDNYGSVRTSIRQFVHMFTRFDIEAVTKQELLDLGLTVSDYAILGFGVLMMFSVSMAGRNGRAREKVAKWPYVLKFTAYVLLLFAVLLFGNYGIGFDAKQFIYNQF